MECVVLCVCGLDWLEPAGEAWPDAQPPAGAALTVIPFHQMHRGRCVSCVLLLLQHGVLLLHQHAPDKGHILHTRKVLGFGGLVQNLLASFA
jgi:hypothetical protein